VNMKPIHGCDVKLISRSVDFQDITHSGRVTTTVYNIYYTGSLIGEITTMNDKVTACNWYGGLQPGNFSTILTTLEDAVEILADAYIESLWRDLEL